MSETDKNLAEILNTDYIPVVQEDKPITIHQSGEGNPDADYSRQQLSRCLPTKQSMVCLVQSF